MKRIFLEKRTSFVFLCAIFLHFLLPLAQSTANPPKGNPQNQFFVYTQEELPDFEEFQKQAETVYFE